MNAASDYRVKDTPFRPNRWMVDSVRWPDSDNSTSNFFEDREAAEIECARRNSQPKRRLVSMPVSHSEVLKKCAAGLGLVCRFNLNSQQCWLEFESTCQDADAFAKIVFEELGVFPNVSTLS